MLLKIFKILSPMQWLEIGIMLIIAFSVFNLITSTSDFFKEKFGFETKATLKEQTIKQEVIIKKLDDANANLADTIKTNVQTAKVNNDVIVNNFQANSKTEEAVKVVQIKKEKIISEIKKNYEVQIATTTDVKAKDELQNQMEKEVSTKQINSIWDIYCSESGTVEECKVNKTIS